MKYKMLVTDYDNTLLGTDGKIKSETWEAVREFERRGGKFTICTGRMLSTVTKTVEPFGLHGEIIAFQGGVVADLDTGEVLMKKYLDSAAALELVDMLSADGYYVQLYADGDYFVNRYTERTARYAKINGLQPVVIGERMREYIELRSLKLDKILFGLDDDASMMNSVAPEDYAALKKVMDRYAERFAGRIAFTTSNILMIESIGPDNTKGKAVEWLANKYSIKREEVICMGDAINDASMVEWAGLGVAVGNATDDLKAVADLVTVTCDEDAVGKIIREYCLES